MSTPAWKHWTIRIDDWNLRRKIRIAQRQVFLAEEAGFRAMEIAGKWRRHLQDLEDVRKTLGLPRVALPMWQPPFNYASAAVISATVALIIVDILLLFR